MTSRAPLLALTATACFALTSVAEVTAAPFTYNPPGKLVSGSGKGNTTTKDYVPGMRFPIEKAPAYPNSQVYMAGGSHGPGGGQCASGNYSYPWWDNYCETRTWSMPLCPSGKGHQGQDIRPGTCEFNKHYVVATEDGTITSIGTYSVYQAGKSGTTHRYLHMKMTALLVKKGTYAKKGQRLGLVDNDFGGTSTTLHLHYDRKQNVSGVGSVYVPTYMSLVNSYKLLIGDTGPKCDAKACAAKSGCGGWSACGGLSSTCDTTGTQTRACTTWACAGDVCKSTTKSESKACSVATDGKIVSSWGAYSACQPTGATCATTGSQQRTRTVCKAGKTSEETSSKACTVATDGKVVAAWSAWTACGGFEWPCDESGVRSRTRTVCKAGAAVTEQQKEACTQSKVGLVVQDWGAWGTCVGASGPCDNVGIQTRVRLVCETRASTPQQQTRPCARDTEGVVVKEPGDWGACEATGDCPGAGVRRRLRTVCKAGAEVIEPLTEPCTATTCGIDAGGSSGGASSGGASSGGGAGASDGGGSTARTVVDSGGSGVQGGADSRGGTVVAPVPAGAPSGGCVASRTTAAPISCGSLAGLLLCLFGGLLARRRRLRPEHSVG